MSSSESKSSTSINSNSSKSVSEQFENASKDSRCDGHRLNVSLLFISIMLLFLFTFIEDEIIPKKLFSKDYLLNSLKSIVPKFS